MIGYIGQTSVLSIALLLSIATVALLTRPRWPKCTRHWCGPIPGDFPADGVFASQRPQHECERAALHFGNHTCRCGARLVRPIAI